MHKDPEVIVETGEQPDACVIWLHGLGADANDFVPIIPQLRLSEETAVRFIFPNAPVIPITINQGYQMPGWYDITSIEIADRGEDVAGIEQSSLRIQRLIDEQIRQGIAADQIIVAGFSQGGAIALHVGLNYPRLLGGAMILSSYLPACAHVESSQNQSLEIIMAHGTQDDVVQYKYGEMSASSLKKHGFDVNWHEYQMPHSVCMEQIEDIARWLQKQLA